MPETPQRESNREFSSGSSNSGPKRTPKRIKPSSSSRRKSGSVIINSEKKRRQQKLTDLINRSPSPSIYSEKSAATSTESFSASPSGIAELPGEGLKISPLAPKLLSVRRQPRNGPTIVVRSRERERSFGDVEKQYYEESVEKLLKTIETIFAGRAGGYSVEELYTIVANLCRYNHAHDIFQKCLSKFKEHLRGVLAQLKASVVDSYSGSPTHEDERDYLQKCTAQFLKWQDQVKLIRNILLNLDRSFLFPRSQSLWDMCMELFGRIILHDASLYAIISSAFNAQLLLLRLGERTLDGMLTDASKMFQCCDVYRKKLEEVITRSAELFVEEYPLERLKLYQSQAGANSERLMHSCVQQVDLERRIGSDLAVRPETANESVRLMMSRMAQRYAATILADVNGFIDNRKFDTARGMFNYAVEFGCFAQFLDIWTSTLRTKGQAILRADSDPKSKGEVPQLVYLYINNSFAVKRSFNGNEAVGLKFRSVLSELFKNPPQRNPQGFATKMAQFSDEIIKAAGSYSNDPDVTNADVLRAIVSLQQYTSGTDYFLKEYQWLLSRRLLQGKSKEGLEQFMLVLLKETFGNEDTKHMEGMLNDMLTSVGINREFKEKALVDKEELHTLPNRITNFYVHILGEHNWPLQRYAPIHAAHPRFMEERTQAFSEYFKQQTVHPRRIRFFPGLGSCIVKARFPKCGVRELHVTELQALVLLQFQTTVSESDKENIGPTLTYQQIKDGTGIDVEERFKGALYSLVVDRAKVLIRIKGDQEKDDRYHINPDFISKSIRIKIPQLLSKSEKKQQETVAKQIEEEVRFERVAEAQTTIMRIMKARKQMTYSELVSQVQSHMLRRGAVPIAEIKKQIDDLLSKEYIERDKANPSLFHYVT
ncbi:hypothetical protein TRVA0_016S01948 [Trichomonascus vanleenenianus]|uniref:cullin family protein n=1 Tax=Trichomonascus vanleenenianus TaxID=2268995 RepID=UPI003EC9B170